MFVPIFLGRHWLSIDRQMMLSDQAVGTYKSIDNCNEQLIMSEQGVAYRKVAPQFVPKRRTRVRRRRRVPSLGAHPVFGG